MVKCLASLSDTLKALALQVRMVWIELGNLDDGAAFVLLMAGPNLLGVVKDFCSLKMSYSKVILVANRLQSIKNKLDAIVKVRFFGDIDRGSRAEKESIGYWTEVVVSLRNMAFLIILFIRERT